MEVQVDKTGPCEAVVSFTVKTDEFEQRYGASLKEAGKRMTVKGFRPGKVPPHVVEKMAGKDLERDVLDNLLRDALQKAVQDESLEPATQPSLTLDELGFERGKDLAHKVTLALKPQFELADYKGLSAVKKEVALEDDDVEKTIEDVRRQQGSPEPAGEDGLEEEGMAMASIELMHGDESVAKREDLRVGPGTPPAGVDADAFKAAMTGAMVGSTHEFELTFPEDYPKEELRGEAGKCRVELSEIYRLVLPSEEDLYKVFGVEDRAGLEAKVSEQLLEAKQGQERQRVESELFDTLIGAHPMPLPEPMLESQIQARRQAAMHQLMQDGMAEPDAEAQVDGDADATREAAEKSLRALFLIEKIGAAEQLLVSQDDMQAELRQIAMRNRSSFEEVRDYYQESNLMQQLSVELLERKVRGFLFDNATFA